MWQHELYKYDVVCMQEVWGIFADEVKETCMAYAQKCGFFWHAKTETPQMHSLNAVDSGLMIFSKHPITHKAFK